MLLELAVRDLGVIDELQLVLGPGTTALTGETGTGKTLVVEAIELLVGGRADAVLVRPGADEARVEGRFTVDGDETVLARVVPAAGRSRAYVDGRLATAGELARIATGLVDLHGQHAHQSLLAPAVQRATLDRFATVDLTPLVDARARVVEIDAALAALGGDARSRAREFDLLRFQVDELDAARLDDPGEDAHLDAEEHTLANAQFHREAAEAAHQALTGDGGVADAIGSAISALAGRPPFADVETRLRSAASEVAEIASDARATGERIEEDPERLEAVRARRQLLRELQRKYGETLTDVMAFGAEASGRLAELEGHGERVALLEDERRRALDAERAAATAVAVARRAAAPDLAAAVEARLRTLALPRARVEVAVGQDDPGDEVTFLLSANPGEPALPLAKVASGGELARAMLAVRLVGDVPVPVMVFDEVDAGIGGEAALAVGRSLAALATEGITGKRQVLVVTHLPQVAAFADTQIAVAKDERSGRTVASARAVAGDDRVVELSRMLSGQPESETARGHAEELLAMVAADREGGARRVGPPEASGGALRVGPPKRSAV